MTLVTTSLRISAWQRLNSGDSYEQLLFSDEMWNSRTSAYRVGRIASIAMCAIIAANALLISVVNSELRWRPTEKLEVVDTGLSIAILWTARGGSSVAMDCMPGMLPQCSISRTRVFIDAPLWLPLACFIALWAAGTWLVRKHHR